MKQTREIRFNSIGRGSNRGTPAALASPGRHQLQQEDEEEAGANQRNITKQTSNIRRNDQERESEAGTAIQSARRTED
jgi:hypothetical protein